MIKKFLADGFSKRAIARKLGISRDTVRRYANHPDDYIPHINRPPVINMVDPYLSHIIKKLFILNIRFKNLKKL